MACYAQQAGKPSSGRRVIIHHKYTVRITHTGNIHPGAEGRYNILVVYGKGGDSGQTPVARLLAAGFGGGDTSFLAEADEFGNGDDPEFLHYATAVDLDRFLGNIQFESDVLAVSILSNPPDIFGSPSLSLIFCEGHNAFRVLLF